MRQSAIQTNVARDRRQHLTLAERVLWHAVRDRQVRGWKFRRKAPAGPFIADFLCVELRLILEIDTGPRLAHDIARQAWLMAQGYVTVRLRDRDILNNLQDCLMDLADRLGSEPAHHAHRPQVHRRPVAPDCDLT